VREQTEQVLGDILGYAVAHIQALGSSGAV